MRDWTDGHSASVYVYVWLKLPSLCIPIVFMNLVVRAIPSITILIILHVFLYPVMSAIIAGISVAALSGEPRVHAPSVMLATSEAASNSSAMIEVRPKSMPNAKRGRVEKSAELSEEFASENASLEKFNKKHIEGKETKMVAEPVRSIGFEVEATKANNTKIKVGKIDAKEMDGGSSGGLEGGGPPTTPAFGTTKLR